MDKNTISGIFDTRILILISGIGLMLALAAQSHFCPAGSKNETLSFMMQLLILAQLTRLTLK